MALLTTRGPPADGGYPRDSDLNRMTDDGGRPAPDPARWADPEWRDDRAGLTDWTPIDVQMPPEGAVVDVVTAAGELLQLKWEGRLWRRPDGAQRPCLAAEYWRAGLAPATGT